MINTFQLIIGIDSSDILRRGLPQISAIFVQYFLVPYLPPHRVMYG